MGYVGECWRWGQECALEADIPFVPTLVQSLRDLTVFLPDETQTTCSTCIPGAL